MPEKCFRISRIRIIGMCKIDGKTEFQSFVSTEIALDHRAVSSNQPPIFFLKPGLALNLKVSNFVGVIGQWAESQGSSYLWCLIAEPAVMSFSVRIFFWTWRRESNSGLHASRTSTSPALYFEREMFLSLIYLNMCPWLVALFTEVIKVLTGKALLGQVDYFMGFGGW